LDIDRDDAFNYTIGKSEKYDLKMYKQMIEKEQEEINSLRR
jgi:hypothetical protein